MGVMDVKGEAEDKLLVGRDENSNEEMTRIYVSARKDYHNPLGHLPSLLFRHIYWFGRLHSLNEIFNSFYRFIFPPILIYMLRDGRL